MSTAGPVYLHYNATAPLRPEAAEAMMVVSMFIVIFVWVGFGKRTRTSEG